MLQKIKTSKNFILLPFSQTLFEEYKSQIYSLYSNESNLLYTGISAVQSQDDLNALFDNYLKRKDFYLWLIIDETNKLYLGDISINVNEQHYFCDVGCFLLKNYWGKNIMKEALFCLMLYLFTERGIHRVEAQVHEFNIRSQRFFEKMGFHFEALLKHNFYVDGTFYDSKLYRILFDEFFEFYEKKFV